jgi:hypothetical protein
MVDSAFMMIPANAAVPVDPGVAALPEIRVMGGGVSCPALRLKVVGNIVGF